MAKSKRAKAQTASWAGMTAEQRQARVKAMQTGRRKAMRRKRAAAKRPQADQMLDMTKEAARFLQLAGSRATADKVLDLAELVGSIIDEH
jgi:hypothetical protein